QSNPGTGPITLGDAAGDDASMLTATGKTISLPINLASGGLGALAVGSVGSSGTATFSGPIELNGKTLTIAPDHPQATVKVTGNITDTIGGGGLEGDGTGVAQIDSDIPSTIAGIGNYSEN